MKENFVISITDTVFINFFVLIKQSQGGRGRFFWKHLKRKCMDIPSVLFSFLETPFKRQSTATEPEIK